MRRSVFVVEGLVSLALVGCAEKSESQQVTDAARDVPILSTGTGQEFRNPCDQVMAYDSYRECMAA
jgi:outer membrane lipoprotein SlyB